MALNIEPGGSTATSYVSAASADTYMNAREDSTAWIQISSASTATLSATTRKEGILKQATREIDQAFRYRGSKYYLGYRGETTYQALEFPRGDDIDANGILYIPDEVKYATYEQALWLLRRTGLQTTEEGRLIEHKTVGKLTKEYLKNFVDRAVQSSGKAPWQGFDY